MEWYLRGTERVSRVERGEPRTDILHAFGDDVHVFFPTNVWFFKRSICKWLFGASSTRLPAMRLRVLEL